MRFVLACITLFATLASSVQAASRPNILLIFTDDQGIHDVGCYGSEIPTPNIDRLASEGKRFTNWYSASSICTPSRYGLLTGRNPSRSQDRLLGALMFMEEEDRRRGIHDGETTFAELLRDTGYYTGIVGKWHLGHGNQGFLPMSHGFEQFIGHTGGCIDYFTMTYGIIPDWYHNSEYVNENGYATELITDEAIDFLTRRSQQRDQPFLLYLAYNAPHFAKGWDPKNQLPINIMQPQAKELQRVADIPDKVRREFGAMVVSLDDGIGRLLDSLESLQLADETLVIFVTDHGGDPVYGGSNLPLRGDKATLFDGGLKVPCLMRWPGKIASESESDDVLSSLDLFPTLCRLTETDCSHLKLDGLEISETILDGKPMVERELFWELGSHAALDRGSWLALRDGDWKLVSTPDGDDFLFDLSVDPNERVDRKQSAPEVFSALREKGMRLSQKFRESK